MGRSTISGILTSVGRQFLDWTAAYRLFSQERINIDYLFSAIRKQLINRDFVNSGSIYAHMDDTHVKKTGKKIPGTSWLRDPLGPPFHTNFIWGQRFIQLSISLPTKDTACQSRAIPVDFYHCPPVKKPKKNENKEAWDEYKKLQKKAKLSQVGSDRIKYLRNCLNNEGAKDRSLVISVDGSYTNETVLKKLPENVTLIGRIRKDCVLNSLPDTNLKRVGRNRVYGERIPTPEQIRQSNEYPWQEVQAWAAGKVHNFNVKVIQNIRWRKSGNKDMQLIVIRPLSYRLNNGSRLLYRQPAYLICTDPKMEISELLQAYLWRWEIEVNFRDEKTLLGCGQAQVRNENSVKNIPAFVAAIYSMILWADAKTKKDSIEEMPRSIWYPKKKEKRITTGDIINNFRASLWAKNININFSHFANLHKEIRSRKNTLNPTLSAILYMRN